MSSTKEPEQPTGPARRIEELAAHMMNIDNLFPSSSDKDDKALSINEISRVFEFLEKKPMESSSDYYEEFNATGGVIQNAFAGDAWEDRANWMFLRTEFGKWLEDTKKYGQIEEGEHIKKYRTFVAISNEDSKANSPLRNPSAMSHASWAIERVMTHDSPFDDCVLSWYAWRHPDETAYDMLREFCVKLIWYLTQAGTKYPSPTDPANLVPSTRHTLAWLKTEGELMSEIEATKDLGPGFETSAKTKVLDALFAALLKKVPAYRSVWIVIDGMDVFQDLFDSTHKVSKEADARLYSTLWQPKVIRCLSYRTAESKHPPVRLFATFHGKRSTIDGQWFDEAYGQRLEHPPGSTMFLREAYEIQGDVTQGSAADVLGQMIAKHYVTAE